MASVFRSRYFRGFLAFFFLGAAFLIGCYGVVLMVDAFDANGSVVGNTALFGLGLFLLVFSPIVLIVGLMNWRKALNSPEDAES